MLGTLPEPEAVALLRAVTAEHRPPDDPAKLAELARLCARLPLALRIAAERAAGLPHLGLDDLIADLRDESALWDVLSVGDEEESDAVRTVFAWSYRALPEPAARLFRRLGLHPGPEFGLHAAAALGELTIGRARQLLDSLVGAHLVEQTAPDRYQFHDLLRAYATDQAQHEESPAQREAALRRVLDWYLHTADAAQQWLSPAEDRLPLEAPADGVQPLAFADHNAAADWAERDRANLLHAVRAAAAAGDDRRAWQSAAALWNVTASSVPAADRIPAGRLGLAAAERLGDRAAQALLLTGLGMDHTRIGRLDAAEEYHRNALALWRELGDRSNEAHALNLLGLGHLRRRQLDDAAAHFAQALAAFRQLGETHWAATALANLAGAHHHAGRTGQALDAAEQVLAACRGAGDRRGEGNVLRLLSDIRREQGKLAAALTYAQEAVEIALSLRNHRLEAFWLLALGDSHRATGRPTEAFEAYHRSAALNRRLGDRTREALAWHGAGQTHLHLDHPAEAAAFFRRAATTHHELGDPWHESLSLDGLAQALHGHDPEAARRHRTTALALLADYRDPRAARQRERIGQALGE